MVEKEIHFRGFELWASGMRIADIASTLNVPHSSIEKWCTRYNWVKRLEERRIERDKESSERYKRMMEEQIALSRAIYGEWAKHFQSLPPQERILKFDHVFKAMQLAQSWIQPSTLKVELQKNGLDPLEVVALAEEAKRERNDKRTSESVS